MTAQADVGIHARVHARWHWSEIAFWILALACAFLFPSRYLIMTDIVRLALFALSLDLILGYAGIVSLGHAAFFGVGAYCAGLLALHGIITEPVVALLAAGLVAMALGFATSFLVIRGADLTRLMVTLGIALLLEALAERFSDITGGTDGLQGIEMAPILGLFSFDMVGKVGFFYCLAVLFLLFLLARRIVHSPFGLSLRAIKNNPLRAAAIGIPVNKRLIAIYTLAAFYAGIAGALFTQSTQLASLDVFAFERSADLMLVLVIGGTGYLYGGLIGAVVFRMLQEVFSTITPQYWQFWIGLVLVVIVLVGRQRLHRCVLWAPNLVIRLLAGSKAAVVVPESDAP
ncbi:MAG TPA: branched-chain amino acid ABC transporter permease [Bradyrhizobium sp.]|uniref:branched-chain amino acid ABC transporter permease n=1 Tax=Bradyrhizobium sp. TaxID=376 RepID=UPI002B83ED51|nr:branched-chain amino acid ABC transporter permease [Bradyrhizobium sp.]HTB00924.1 branched-chain amino acid ABC transporter permease [Bradyrhizobium sp.]